MTPDPDMQLLLDRERAETRCVDLVRRYPDLAQEAGDRLLASMLESWSQWDSPFHEFLYHVAWLGCHRVKELNHERYTLEQYEGEDDDGVPA